MNKDAFDHVDQSSIAVTEAIFLPPAVMAKPHGNLVELPQIFLNDLPAPLVEPYPRIRSESDVTRWKFMQSYHNYLLFVSRLNRAVIGVELGEEGQPLPAVGRFLALLDVLDTWIDEIPPLATPQRFGNLAFRDWGKRLEERGKSLLENLLIGDLQPATTLIYPYLLTGFGSFTRMDYGSGHELSFGLLLLCLTLIRFFQPEPREEQQLVLLIFARYLRLVWRLQDVYKLEPAGSHGVWGLDDYQFLSYLWGSAQLMHHPSLMPASVLDPHLQPTNLYNLSIMRIHQLKTGPFHEHSPQLYSIASSVALWSKVNSGLFKMYEAEVLGKRVVVQHVPFGGLLPWETTEPPHGPMENISPTRAPRADYEAVAPWASPAATGTQVGPDLRDSQYLPPTQAPWATTTPSARPMTITGLHWPTSLADTNMLPPPRISTGLGTLRDSGGAAALISPMGSLPSATMTGLRVVGRDKGHPQPAQKETKAIHDRTSP